MFVGIRVDTSMNKGNQNVQLENSNEYLIDPFGEIINTLRSFSAIGLPRFVAHKAKTSLVLSIESLGNLFVIDIRVLLYIITLVGAITSVRFSINSTQKSVYLFEYKINTSIKTGSKLKTVYNTKLNKICQIVGFSLTMLSIIIPSFTYNILNSQVVII